MRNFAILFFVAVLLCSCDAVRLSGKISQVTGNELVKAADKEEAEIKKQEAAKNGTSAKAEVKKTDNAAAMGDSVTVKKSANVRSGPSTRKPVVFVIRAGVLVEALEENNGWTKIKDDGGKTGWVKSSLLSR